MKIEVDYEEIEALKADVERYKSEAADLRNKLQSLDKDEIEKKGVEVGRAIFEKYIKKTFKELGFDYSFFHVVDFDMHARTLLRKNPYDIDSLEIKLGATIVDDMKTAFLRIGVMAEKK